MSNDLITGLLVIIVFMLCGSLGARWGICDAFEYKKSTTRVRKEKKMLPAWRKLLCWYPPEQSHVPWHMRRFRRFRIFYLVNFVCSVMVFVFSDSLPPLLAWLVIIPGIALLIADFSYYFIVLHSWSDKKLHFENAKRQ